MRLIFALCAILLCGVAQAQSGSGGSSTSTAFCDKARPTTAAEQDRILRFAAAVRDELNLTGSDTVIISRSGLDLSRFHIRYSHAAIMIRGDQEGETGNWTARQLYYACDEGRPRIYDQGLAGFASGSDDPAVGYISIVVMPSDAAKSVRQASQNNVSALELLASTYSANAYPFSTSYQNCNQWVIEMLAVAWGNLRGGDDLRPRAQDWLKEQHYDPEPVKVGSGLLMIASLFTPMLHLSDHPRTDRSTMLLKVSLPSTIETFVKERWPATPRIELCHTSKQIVVHHGWKLIEDGCQAGDGDSVIALD